MSLKASKAKLARASKDLSTAWDQVSNSWRDQKSKQFETKYIAPIPDSISSA
ncbi:MAG: hypothetical protein ACI8XO_003640, partial [Verrucomicrobiales bacterium]